MRCIGGFYAFERLPRYHEKCKRNSTQFVLFVAKQTNTTTRILDHAAP
jgi:hypothetical protein